MLGQDMLIIQFPNIKNWDWTIEWMIEVILD